GYTITSADGDTALLNPLASIASLRYNLHQPAAALAIDLRQGLTWRRAGIITITTRRAIVVRPCRAIFMPIWRRWRCATRSENRGRAPAPHRIFIFLAGSPEPAWPAARREAR